MKYLIAAILMTTAAYADEPTVTLTQRQLTSLLQAESAKAVAAYVTQERTAAAKDAYEAVDKAFQPKPNKDVKP